MNPDHHYTEIEDPPQLETGTFPELESRGEEDHQSFSTSNLGCLADLYVTLAVEKKSPSLVTKGEKKYGKKEEDKRT
jgi:hypothetical protein